MEFVLHHDQTAYLTRSRELAFLANTLHAGSSFNRGHSHARKPRTRPLASATWGSNAAEPPPLPTRSSWTTTSWRRSNGAGRCCTRT
jgi:hypothetical protein